MNRDSLLTQTLCGLAAAALACVLLAVTGASGSAADAIIFACLVLALAYLAWPEVRERFIRSNQTHSDTSS